MHQLAQDRRLDADVDRERTKAHPRVLGALLDLAARIASDLPTFHLDTSPRMADYARVLGCVDTVLGTEGLARYTNRAANLAVDALTAEAFVVAMGQQLQPGFTGSSLTLHSRIAHGRVQAPKGWPSNARLTTMLLKRQAPVMRLAGWTIDELPAGHDNVVQWRIIRPEKAVGYGSRASHAESTRTQIN